MPEQQEEALLTNLFGPLEETEASLRVVPKSTLFPEIAKAIREAKRTGNLAESLTEENNG